jgi:hypothetical protein
MARRLPALFLTACLLLLAACSGRATPPAAPTVIQVTRETVVKQLVTATPSVAATDAPSAQPTATLAPAAAAPTAAPTAPAEAVVLVAVLNMRSGPGQNYAIVGKLAKGDKVYPVAMVNNCAWLQAGIPSRGSDLVWVAGGPQYVKLSVPCASLMVQDSIPATPTRAPAPTAAPVPTRAPAPTVAPASVPRPGTGLLSRAGASGSGVLRIKNGTDTDGVVILTTLAEQPVQAAYIRIGDTYEMQGIPDGSYRLYFTKGDAWDPQAKQFTQNVTRQRFADTLTFGGMTAGFEVTLYGVSGGNARTEGVPEGSFPALP